jgi:hypothetical protein
MPGSPRRAEEARSPDFVSSGGGDQYVGLMFCNDG